MTTGYKNCFVAHGLRPEAWYRRMWSATATDGLNIITLRTDNHEFNWRTNEMCYRPDALDDPQCWQAPNADGSESEGMRLIQRCADSHYLALPVRVILRDREDNATAWIDDRWFWARIYYVGSPGAGDYGLVKGVLLPKQAYPKLTK